MSTLRLLHLYSVSTAKVPLLEAARWGSDPKTSRGVDAFHPTLLPLMTSGSPVDTWLSTV